MCNIAGKGVDAGSVFLARISQSVSNNALRGRVVCHEYSHQGIVVTQSQEAASCVALHCQELTLDELNQKRGSSQPVQERNWHCPYASPVEYKLSMLSTLGRLHC
jgi:hypothetical protein